MKSAFLIATAINFCNYNLFAQEENKDTIKPNNLKEVVITINKKEELKRNLYQQIQTIDSAEIEKSQSQNTADLIGNNSLAFIQKSQQGGGSITIRGLEANRNLLVIDGVRMNNLIYRGGHLQNIITTDNNYLDKVEILFGPASTIFGSDALGGVVHLYTKNPLFALEKNLIKVNTLSRYSSVNKENTQHLDLNFGLNKIAFLTSVTYSAFGDLMGGKNQNPFYTNSYGERPFYVKRINGIDSLVKNSNKYLQTNSGYNQIDLMQKISFKQSDKLIHNLNIQFSNSSDIPRYDRLTDPAGNGLKQAEWYYGPQKRILGIYSFKYKNEIGFFQQISTNINFQDILESRHTRRFNKNGIQNRNEHVNVYGFNIDAIKNIKKHLLHFGIDGQYNTLISKANEENIVTGEINKIDTRYPDGNNNMANISAYLLHNYKINDYLCLMEGIRAGYTVLNSSFKDTSFFKFPVNSISQKTPVYSGSFGIINNPSDELKLSAGIATGYRVPNIDDLSKVFESVPGRVILPNSNIKPEKTITYDLSVTNFIKTSTQIENTFYYTDFFDAITTQAFQYNGVDSILYMGTKSKVYANQNNRRAYIYGYSNSLKSTLTRHLNINFSFNYTYGRIKTDSSDYPLDHIPPVISRLSLNYINKGFQGFFFLNYNGWKRLKDYYIGGEDNENYATPLGMPGWITLNLRTSYSFKKFIILNTGIENILDTQYRVFASGINGGGRNLYASIQIKF